MIVQELLMDSDNINVKQCLVEISKEQANLIRFNILASLYSVRNVGQTLIFVTMLAPTAGVLAVKWALGE